MTTLTHVEEEELRTVRSRLLRLLDEDERERAGSVYLEVVDGARWWVVAAPWYLVALRGGQDEGLTEAVGIPRRVIATHLDGDMRLYVPLKTEDGHYRQPVTATIGLLHVEFWPATRADIGWRELLADRAAASGERVSVQVRTLVSALNVCGMRPYDIRGEGEGLPAARLRASVGQLEVTVAWPRHKSVTAVVPAEAAGEAEAWVYGNDLLDVLFACANEQVDLHLPHDRAVPVGCASSDTTAVIEQASRDADLNPYRRTLEKILRETFDVAPRRDADGNYPFEVADTRMFLRLARRPDGPPVVHVFAKLVDHAEQSPELLQELNDLNAGVSFCRIFHVDGQVLSEDEIVASNLNDEDLRASCMAVHNAVRRFRPLLQARFGIGPAEPSTPPIPWEEFASTSIRVRSTEGWVTFEPLPEGGECEGAWPFLDHDRVAVVTAYDPVAQPRDDEENERAQQTLVADLFDAGYTLTQAVSVSEDGSHSEASAAVFGAPDRAMLAVARRYGQAAVFVLHRRGIDVVGVDGRTVSSRPWRVHHVAPEDEVDDSSS